jgi:hypothetical protein
MSGWNSLPMLYSTSSRPHPWRLVLLHANPTIEQGGLYR